MEKEFLQKIYFGVPFGTIMVAVLCFFLRRYVKQQDEKNKALYSKMKEYRDNNKKLIDVSFEKLDILREKFEKKENEFKEKLNDEIKKLSNDIANVRGYLNGKENKGE